MPVWLGDPFGNFVVLRRFRKVSGGGSPPGGDFPPAGGINAMDYCHGDGATDDRQHILDAITAAGGAHPVYFPDGTYYLASLLTVPNGTVLVGPPVSALAYPVSGCDTPTSWIKGPLRFGSNSTFSDLRIGTQNSSVCNASGASTTSFTRCQFRGGGGSGAPGYVTFMLGGQAGSCDHITLTDCNVERCMATDSQRNADGGNKFYCTFIINARIGGESVSYVTIDGCHIGTSNGMTSGQGVAVNTGSPQATFLCWTAHGAGTSTWNNITLTDTVLEFGEWDCIDLADYRDGSICNTLTFTNCWLKGGTECTLCIEGPQYIEFDSCTFNKGGEECMYLQAYASDSTRYTYWNIHDCTFDLLAANAAADIGRYYGHITLNAGGNYFERNTINGHSHGIMLQLGSLAFHHSTVQDNIINDYLTSTVANSFVYQNCNTVSILNNAFWNASTTNPAVYTANNTNMTISGNTYTHA